jgi:hypothetical protein
MLAAPGRIVNREFVRAGSSRRAAVDKFNHEPPVVHQLEAQACPASAKKARFFGANKGR